MRRQPLLFLMISIAASAILLRSAPSGAQQDQDALQQEIAEVERHVDSLEAEALAAIPSLLPGSPQRLPLSARFCFLTRSSRSSGTRHAPSATCRRPGSREPSKV